MMQLHSSHCQRRSGDSPFWHCSQSSQTFQQELTSLLCLTKTVLVLIISLAADSGSKVISFQPSIFSPLFQVIFWSFNWDRILPCTGCGAKCCRPDAFFFFFFLRGSRFTLISRWELELSSSHVVPETTPFSFPIRNPTVSLLLLFLPTFHSSPMH